MRRAGFTLIEIMVALMILSGLIALMVPVILDQATRGEPTRVASELSAVGSALSIFRAHTGTLPDDIEDLVNPIGPADRQINGQPYSQSMIRNWRGPYLDISMEEAGAADPLSPDSIRTGFKAYISPVLALFDGVANDSLPLAAAADANFVAAIVRGLSVQEFESLSRMIDGDALPEGTAGCVRCSWNRGNFRWDPSSNIAYFLVAPFRTTN